MKISHPPYFEPLLAGDLPKPEEVDAIIHDETGQRTKTFV
jgi:hypothetical protein